MTVTIGEIITWANEQIMEDVRTSVEQVAATEEGKAETKLAQWKELNTLLPFAIQGSLPGDDGEPY